MDYVDQPTMALLPLEFTTGTVSVDIHSQLTPEAPDYARGFAGIAFHVTPALDHFESVYLRPTKPRKNFFYRGFNAVYGFLSCVAMVLFARVLGWLVKRPDDYYERPRNGAQRDGEPRA